MFPVTRENGSYPKWRWIDAQIDLGGNSSTLVHDAISAAVDQQAFCAPAIVTLVLYYCFITLE